MLQPAVVVFRLAAWLVVVRPAVVQPTVDREFVGRPFDVKAVDSKVVGLGVVLVVIEPAQWRLQAVPVQVLLAVAAQLVVLAPALRSVPTERLRRLLLRVGFEPEALELAQALLVLGPPQRGLRHCRVQESAGVSLPALWPPLAPARTLGSAPCSSSCRPPEPRLGSDPAAPAEPAGTGASEWRAAPGFRGSVATTQPGWRRLLQQLVLQLLVGFEPVAPAVQGVQGLQVKGLQQPALLRSVAAQRLLWLRVGLALQALVVMKPLLPLLEPMPLQL